MEWLWHVDDCDEPIGRVERSDAHARMLMHRAGIVFLLDAAERVYLTKRAASKRIFPDSYDSSASFHVAYGESYEEAAGREALEELGLQRPLIGLGKLQHRDPPENQWVAVFVMRYAGEVIALDPAEASSGAFYSLAEASRIIERHACTPWLRDGLPMLTAWVGSRALLTDAPDHLA
jgi:isopentenyldiphosphate isomerase